MGNKTVDVPFMTKEYVKQIEGGARVYGQRTGQYLFNHLPDGAANKLWGKLFDPFHRDLTSYELEDWISNHLIFSESGQIIGLFNNDDILWEA